MPSNGYSPIRMKLLAWQTELLIGIILLFSLLLRVYGWNETVTAPFVFSHMAPLYVEEVLEKGDLFRHWWHFLQTFQAQSQDFAIYMPVFILFQVVIGSAFYLPLLVGAVFGVTGIFLAYAAGRTLHDTRFGLVFAGLLAISPLNILWSRLGGIYITGVTHVLLVMWLAALAGTKQRKILCIITGIAAWTSMYQYYAARVAIPLAVFIIWYGLWTRRALWKHYITLSLVLLMTLVSCYVLTHIGNERNSLSTLWPSYPGYVGNRNENNLAEVFKQTELNIRSELPKSLGVYFWKERSGGDDGKGFWNLRSGGLCLLPVSLLGAFGGIFMLRHPLRYSPWLIMALMGLALPVLSVPTARRLLVFDTAWCAWAAAGCLCLQEMLAKSWNPRASKITAIGCFFIFGIFSAWTLFGLHRALPPISGTVIPFGESGFGDGLTCLHCYQTGEIFQKEIEQNHIVVVFDTDLERENATCPGGLYLYGRLGALNAKRLRNFVQFYPLWNNFNQEPPNIGTIFDGTKTNFAEYLIQSIEKSGAEEILWHFECPTQWEVWFADRLQSEGGFLTRFKTPLSQVDGIQVRTPWRQREKVFALLKELNQQYTPSVDSSDRVILCTEKKSELVPFHLTLSGQKTENGLPDWIAASWDQFEWGKRIVNFAGIAGISADQDDNGRIQQINLINRQGYTAFLNQKGLTDSLSEPQFGLQISTPNRIGFNCAERINGHWWIVDPITGTLLNDQSAEIPVKEPWTGIARISDDKLLLASARQSLHLIDIKEGREVLSFPAVVSPSRRCTFGECSLIGALDDGYVSYNPALQILHIYDGKGTPRDVVDLGQAINAKGFGLISTLKAQNNYLGMGLPGGVRTVVIKPEKTQSH